ncbi:AAA family ATPase [Candidatus Microgenomates bacterium]|nr:AAA family ATPase [Candidatus Microgenomates bacterium]
MVRKLVLHNFRNYGKRAFEFDNPTTLIVGPNAIGKTNIIEAIYLLATGRSFRAQREDEVIKDNQMVASVTTEGLEVIFDNRGRFTKLYRVNGVGRRQVDFVGNLKAVLFCPQDIEIATDSPSIRRHYLDSVLETIFKDYRIASHIYEKALRQRNRLLWRIREEPHFAEASRGEELDYWDDLLITNGKIIHERRKDYLIFLNLPYDHSVISAERLERYRDAEIGAATTLVGPHRDDFKVVVKGKNIKSFGSRGEQRLSVFNIKLGELAYIEKITGEKPVLLLDDVFSELDHENRHMILDIIPKQQTIMTTTDLRLVEKSHIKEFQLIEP